MGLRLFAACFALLLHALVGWLLLNPDWFARYRGKPASPETTLSAVRPLPATQLQDAPAAGAGSTLDSAARADRGPSARPSTGAYDDAELRAAHAMGRRGSERRHAAYERQLAAETTPEIAALLSGPPHLAWSRLEAMATAGDRLAGDALVLLANDCDAKGHGSDPDRSALLRLSARLQQSASAWDAAYVSGAIDHERERELAYGAQCREHGIGWGRLAAMLGLPDPTAGLVSPWQDWPARQALLEEFQSRFGGGAAPEPTASDRAWERLGSEPAPAHAADDLAVLMAAADDEPQVAERLAICFEYGCRNVPRLPAEQLPAWQERAARQGSTIAADARAAGSEARGEWEIAWAWAWYARWLALNACGWQPRVVELANASERLQRIGNRLDAAAIARAQAMASSLVARYGPGALAASGCPG